MRSDWVEVELGNVCNVNMGQSPPSSTYNRDGIGLPFFQGKAEFTELHPVVEKWCDAPKKTASKNDVLISVRAPVGATNIATERCAIGRGLAAISYYHCYKYLFYYLRLVETQLDKIGTGTTFKAISGSTLKSLNIPFAPVPEQRAIVAKIDQLFSRLDYGIASFKAAQEKLATYRQSMLKKAFEGEFTKMVIEYKPLSDFAELITKGASPNWQGFSYTSDDAQLLYITSENVREGYMDLSKRKYLPYEFNQKQKRSVLQKGDVLFNLVGASIGRSAIYNVERVANINQAVSVIRLKKDLVNQYLNYFLNSDVAKQVYLSKKVDVARANLSLKDVNEIEVPYCPIQDQVKIVKEIESRFSVCDHLQQEIEQGLQRAEALRQSVLKKAFKGRLLTETELADCRAKPGWEPAQQLLAQIQSEKSVVAKKAISDKS